MKATRLALDAAFAWCVAMSPDGRTAYFGTGDQGRIYAVPVAASAGLRRRTVKVFIPRFKMLSEIDLTNNLRGMGIVDAFDENGKADFSGIDGTKRLCVNDILHKAFVIVNEEGTEAAAVTAVHMFTIGGDEPSPQVPEFRADHPFIFLICGKGTGTILFMGRLADPSAASE
jgi:serpin B